MGEGRGGGDHRDAIWSETVLAVPKPTVTRAVWIALRAPARGCEVPVRLDRTDAKLHFARLRRQPRQGETLPRPAAARLERRLGEAPAAIDARDAEMGEDENVVYRGDGVGHLVRARASAILAPGSRYSLSARVGRMGKRAGRQAIVILSLLARCESVQADQQLYDLSGIIRRDRRFGCNFLPEPPV